MSDRDQEQSMVIPPPSMRAKLVGIAMAVFAAFGGCLYGYDTGYIAGIKEMSFWLETFGEQADSGFVLSTANNSLVTSILSVGTFFGALLASPIGDIFGRRWGVIASCLILCVGVTLQVTSTTIPIFAVGRVFSGLGVGLTSCLVPMYQSECAPKWIRGAIVACYQLAITIGLLIAAVMVNLTKDRPDAGSYRIPITLQAFWASILAIGLFCLPESPKYLILKGREKEARASLGRLLSLSSDSQQVSREYDDVADSLAVERTLGAGSYADCFKSGPGRYRLRTLTGCAIQALQQASGFFKNSGVSDPFLTTVIINVVNVVCTFPGIWAVDKIGRRKLLLLGAAVMFICEFVVALLGLLLPATDMVGQRALIAFVCIFIGGFASTWGPLAWVVTSEIYPLVIRAKAMSLSTASSWVVNFAFGFSTPYLVDVGPGKAGLKSNVFWIWGGCCTLCFVFTFFFIPETKGLSLEQVDELYQKSSMIGSDRYRRRMLAGLNIAGNSQENSQETMVGLEIKEVRHDGLLPSRDINQA
ncbi:hypothetical protein CROQUDRAFT_649802 [Cronartium quercuum f. sp. fusiforme G11]|uniref:Major facilitator superfamily (MFS) profile domain-containing protein n=1 Tax=Cronartium quercuum f. sp. fusiforme G11 TaxID=708437 RepID=A0A9P6THS7_9BASI|nr:hypothetical protein CROQUDRAFT_649802 [Cronartium quercuum f. sp. fusiforme G11]